MDIIKKLLSGKKRGNVPYPEYRRMRRFLAGEIKKRNEIIEKLREENRVLLRSSIKSSEKLQLLREDINKKEPKEK